MGAHKPLTVNDGFLPQGVDQHEAERVSQDAAEYNCNVEGHDYALAILRGLYLAGVAENDRKLNAILDRLAKRGLATNLVTIVTSDHGEQFGEHNLVDHQFSIREPLLRVPLVIQGKGAPAVVAEPVSLVDLMPSILTWAGITPEPSDGRELPLTSQAAADSRVLLADYDALQDYDTPYFGSMLRKLRRHCDGSDRIHGDMRAALRFPMKLLWFADGASELYDVRADPEERHDLAPSQPDLVAELTRLVTPDPAKAAGR
jgi:arylsulfatase A-like enzyme